MICKCKKKMKRVLRAVVNGRVQHYYRCSSCNWQVIRRLK